MSKSVWIRNNLGLGSIGNIPRANAEFRAGSRSFFVEAPKAKAIGFSIETDDDRQTHNEKEKDGKQDGMLQSVVCMSYDVQ